MSKKECAQSLRVAGLPSPRTCDICGLGPCQGWDAGDKLTSCRCEGIGCPRCEPNNTPNTPPAPLGEAVVDEREWRKATIGDFSDESYVEDLKRYLDAHPNRPQITLSARQINMVWGVLRHIDHLQRDREAMRERNEELHAVIAKQNNELDNLTAQLATAEATIERVRGELADLKTYPEWKCDLVNSSVDDEPEAVMVQLSRENMTGDGFFAAEEIIAFADELLDSLNIAVEGAGG